MGVAALLWWACAAPPDATVDDGPDLRGRALSAPAPSIPSVCYTRTEGRNPCFTCHNQADPPNFSNRPDLQVVAAFPAPAAHNPWTNLFVDRSAAVAATPVDDIAAYVRTDNYHDGDGAIALASRLAAVPRGWDADGDGAWAGWVPDVAFAPDGAGFDVGPDGPTGWWAYNFAPFPGFFATNGSMGDAFVRLPAVFRVDARGRPDPAVYRLNLAILEAVVRRADVPIAPVDEGAFGVDLDQDGRLGVAATVVYRGGPRAPRTMSWVGAAKGALARGEVGLVGGLFPEGVEFAHSVRYLDVVDGEVRMAARMKELRYLRKVDALSVPELHDRARTDLLDELVDPDAVDRRYGDLERGLGTGRGWVVQGFVEDADGALRPQTFEETAFCVGCHANTSATTDGVFSFARRVDAGPLADPRRGDGAGEYATWLAAVGAFDDFGANRDPRWFDDAGLRPEAVAALSRDVRTLFAPSPDRAWALDVAYREIVREQSFARGRDAAWGLGDAVWRDVPEDQPTGVTAPIAPAWMAQRSK